MTDASSPVRLAFIVTEDWFFVSHFMPMLVAARSLGFEVIVITRISRHSATIENMGARVISLNADRGSVSALSILTTIKQIANILKREKVDIVHCIALRCIVTGGIASVLSGIRRSIFAVTGGGYLAADGTRKTKLAICAIKSMLGMIGRFGTSHFLFENQSDPLIFGMRQGPSVTILGGAGVDPDKFPMLPPRRGEGLKLAIVCRMVWSKGVDIAVEAVVLARQKNCNITLSLYGLPDKSNPRSLSETTLRNWSKIPGIKWNGSTDNVRLVWADHDVACVPSRGGEGLPRSLLEAAACGKPILTSNVPGCRDFVRDGLEGWVLETGNVQAIANKLCLLAEDKEAVFHAGSAARRRVFDGFTERQVMEEVQRVYSTMAP